MRVGRGYLFIFLIYDFIQECDRYAHFCDMFALPRPRALCHHQLLEAKAAGLKSRIVQDLTGQIQNTSSDFILQEQILPCEMHADSFDVVVS